MASTSSLPKRIIRTAATLPQLLGTLPKDGLHALVRPTNWPETSFYKITRTALKFRPRYMGSPESIYTKKTVKYMPGAKEKAEKEAREKPIGELTAYGKAWGMRYYKGYYQRPPRLSCKPDEEIRKGRKVRWALVPHGSLPDHAKQQVDQWEQVLSEGHKVRDLIIRSPKKPPPGMPKRTYRDWVEISREAEAAKSAEVSASAEAPAPAPAPAPAQAQSPALEAA